MYPGTKGTAFYDEKWNRGYIILKNKQGAEDISLSYNVYDNQIYFLKDSNILVPSELTPVEEFGIYDQIDSGKATIFRCGYSPVGRNTGQTFYVVVSDNKIALLKHCSKSVAESVGTGEKTFVDAEKWYVYNSKKNKMVAIKKNETSLIKALPKYAGIIHSITSQKNLKLKDETDWNILFRDLNNQVK
jgi:hypothetical protein